MSIVINLHFQSHLSLGVDVLLPLWLGLYGMTQLFAGAAVFKRFSGQAGRRGCIRCLRRNSFCLPFFLTVEHHPSMIAT